jgi:pimeloyl-ACP methyl ester carboxylesterase
VSYDRPGYGESDPHPKQTMKSLALDMEELANQLELGSKFYVIGSSIGNNVVWGCLNYIPHRYQYELPIIYIYIYIYIYIISYSCHH